MKKSEIASLIVYLLMLVLAICYGLFFIRPYSEQSGMSTFPFILFILSSVLAGVILNAILFELAHMLGAKIGGYKITSVCILGFTFHRVSNKIHFQFSNFDGLTGQTKILPNSKKKKHNPSPYLICGSIFYVVELLIIVFAYSYLTATAETAPLKNLAYFLLTMGVVGGVILIYNIVPLQLDSLTDGYRLKLAHSKTNKNAFDELLYNENGIVEINEKTDEIIKNAYSSDLRINNVYTYLSKHDFINAEKAVDELLANKEKISKKMELVAKAQKIYLVIMSKSIEEAQEYYEKEVPHQLRRDIADDNGIVPIRAYMLMSGLLDKSKFECIYSAKKAYKAYKRTEENRRNLETILFNEVLDKVLAAHPTWTELEQYRFIVNKEEN